jgi:hypothetical protein
MPPPPPLSPPPIQESVSDGLKIGIAVGSVVFPLLGIVMGAIYMNNASLAKKKVGKLWLFIGIGAMVFWCLIAAGSSQSSNYRGY